jgi:peptide/nickel transport system substrate-binding protein
MPAMRRQTNPLPISSVLAMLLLVASACARAPESPPTPAAKPTQAAAAAPTQAPAAQPTQAPTSAAAKPAAAATTAPAAQPTQAPAAAAPARGGELIVGKDQEAPGIDPAKNPATAAIRVFDLLYSRLTRLDDQMRAVPDLAEKWDVSADAKTYTFNLRKGVKFHNGRDLTSADVKYTYERILNPDTASIARSFFDVIQSIETPDPNTVRFVLKEPFAPFLVNTANAWTGIVAKEIVEANNGDLNKVEAGSGPFKLQEWLPDTRTVLMRDPNYYIQGQPVVDKITFLIMKEESARIAALRTGNIHFTTLTAAGADTVKGDSNLTVVSAPTLSYGYLGMNVGRKPFDDTKVRQAVNYVVDRTEIIGTVYRGHARLTGVVPTAMTEFAVDPSKLDSYKANVDKAKALMNEAGMSSGFKTTVMAMSSIPSQVESAQVIQSQLKRINIDAEIQPLEVGVYVDNWRKKAMDMMVGGNGAGTNPDRAVCFFFCTNGSANVWNFTDPRVDELAAQARTQADVAKAKPLYDEAQMRIIDLAPNLFLANPDQFIAYLPTVKGFKPMPDESQQYLIQTGLQQ